MYRQKIEKDQQGYQTITTEEEEKDDSCYQKMYRQEIEKDRQGYQTITTEDK